MNTVYQKITKVVIEKLEKGVAPWRQPWADLRPKNMISGKQYSGINYFVLLIEAEEKGYSSNYWVTYLQAQSKMGQVRKGERGTPILFWNRKEKEDQDGEIKTYVVARNYTVFNVEQCDWKDPTVVPVDKVGGYNPIERAQNIIDKMDNRPIIKRGNGGAYYHPRKDYVNLPWDELFATAEDFYPVAFHELAHSTGHPSRLGRFDYEVKLTPFGSCDYSKEELVAELTAAFLCADAGVKMSIDNSAAYIAEWLNVLKADSKFIVTAASLAQKATDFILGVKGNDDDSR